MIKAIANALFFTGTDYLRAPYLLFENDKIIGFCDTLDNFNEIEILNFSNCYCLPGFIDLQVNGGGGIFFTKDHSQEGLLKIAETYRKHGTTSFLPTLVSSEFEKIFPAIESVRQAMADPLSGVIGIHLEGPFLNPEKRGAHLQKYLRKPDAVSLQRIVEKSREVIALMTIAPELFSNENLAILSQNGIRLSAGHSNASYVEVRQFYEKGISKVTHLFNAMSAFQSREPGLVGAFLDHPEWYGGIIADGKHVDFASLRIAHRLKRGKLFFVTDSVYVDFKGDHFEINGANIRRQNGVFVNDENNLAGAALTMQEAIRNSIRFAQIPEADAFRMATSIPADYLGMSAQIGYLKKDAFADFVILDKDYQIKQVIFKGKKVINH